MWLRALLHCECERDGGFEEVKSTEYKYPETLLNNAEDEFLVTTEMSRVAQKVRRTLLWVIYFACLWSRRCLNENNAVHCVVRFMPLTDACRAFRQCVNLNCTLFPWTKMPTGIHDAGTKFYKCRPDVKITSPVIQYLAYSSVGIMEVHIGQTDCSSNRPFKINVNNTRTSITHPVTLRYIPFIVHLTVTCMSQHGVSMVTAFLKMTQSLSLSGGRESE